LAAWGLVVVAIMVVVVSYLLLRLAMAIDAPLQPGTPPSSFLGMPNW
jgi:hypothetical protein